MNKGSVRVLQVLSLFAQKPTWGVTEVSRAMACGKNSAFQALDTLLEEGFVVRDPSGNRYQLSHRAMDFRHSGENFDIRALCRDTLVKLSELTGQSTFLSIVVGRLNLTIDSVMVNTGVSGFKPATQPLQLHVGTGSRLLLAFLHDDEITQYIEVAGPFAKVTDRTLTTAEEIWDEVRRVRACGFARGTQDMSPNSNYLSFPVFGALDRPIAAITIGGAVQTFPVEEADRLIPVIAAEMAELNTISRLFPPLPPLTF